MNFSSGTCTFGLDKWLENLADVKSAPFTVYDPIQRSTLLAWERRNGFQLPEDLQSFFLSTDGIQLIWYASDEKEISGQIKIFQLMTVKLLEKELAENVENVKGDKVEKQYFVLGPADYDSGKVMIEKESKKLYYLDNSLVVHDIPCENFTEYYRLCILHCGVRSWHFIFTDVRIPLASLYLLRLVAPNRLKLYEDRFKEKPLDNNTAEEDEEEISEEKKYIFDTNIIRSNLST